LEFLARIVASNPFSVPYHRVDPAQISSFCLIFTIEQNHPLCLGMYHSAAVSLHWGSSPKEEVKWPWKQPQDIWTENSRVLEKVDRGP
jgi:hypothetical protein